MLSRIWDRLKFALERFVLGGPLNRLFVIAVLIAFLAFLGGALVHMFGFRPGDSAGFRETIWWAFLRLTDPGYLGDDHGTFVRIVSTVLTVLGYVVFLGSLVAIMTQYLNSNLLRLQLGLTPLALNNHVLILGWSSRTVAIVREILLSEARVERFLMRKGAARLRVVILAEQVVPEMVQELRDRLGDMWDPRQIILRSGSPLRLEHLRRADFLHAAAIVLPAPESASEPVEYPDARTVKTILATGKSSRSDGATEMPLMVAELADATKLEIASKAYGGPIEVVASDLIIGRLLAQSIRHPGISQLYSELLRHDSGNEIYLREFPELVGRNLNQVMALFPRAVPLGLLHGSGSECVADLNPGPDVRIRPGDRMVLLAAGFDDARPVMAVDATRLEIPLTASPGALTIKTHRRILMLGWNHVVPAFIRELEGFHGESFEVDIVSQVSPAERQLELARVGMAAAHTRIRMIEGEYTALEDLKPLAVTGYDNVVILSSDRLESEGERDARSILGGLVLRELVGGAQPRPDVLIELLDVENVGLVWEAGDETLLSPAVMSHILTQVALHRDLRVVYDELFGPRGAEMFFRPASEFDMCHRPLQFDEIQAAASRHNEIALGLRLYEETSRPQSRVILNPDKVRSWTLGNRDEIVVLTRP